MNDPNLDPGRELAERANKYILQNPGTRYLDAIRTLMKLDQKNAELVRRYGQRNRPCFGPVLDRSEHAREYGQQRPTADTRKYADINASVLLAEKVSQHMEKTGEKVYRVALRQVIVAHPDLAAAYADQCRSA
jgi:hypothetical protein